MKRVLFIVAVVGVLFTCTKFLPQRDQSEIAFVPLTGAVSTKTGPISVVTYPTTSPSFASFAYKGTSLYVPECEIKYSGSAWKCNDAHYWPADGHSLTFYSYSPYAINGIVECTALDGLSINSYDVYATHNRGHDVMIADKVVCSANDVAARQSGVPTVFRHKLAYIDALYFSTADNYRNGNDVLGDKKFTIERIVVGGALHVGTYSQIADTWTTSGSSDNVVWYADSEGTFLTHNALEIGDLSYLFVMPQDLSDDVKIVIDYREETFNGTKYIVDNVTKEIKLNQSHTKWEIGKKYTYNIVLSLNGIHWAPSISDWVDESVDCFDEA